MAQQWRPRRADHLHTCRPVSLNVGEVRGGASLSYFRAFLGLFPEATPHEGPISQLEHLRGAPKCCERRRKTYFEVRNYPDLQARFKIVVRDALCLSPRRNEIAHGVVDHFRTKEEWIKYGWSANDSGSYALYPSLASFRERDSLARPSYCMTSVELAYFHEQITSVQPEPIHLADAIISGRAAIYIFLKTSPALHCVSQSLADAYSEHVRQGFSSRRLHFH